MASCVPQVVLRGVDGKERKHLLEVAPFLPVHVFKPEILRNRALHCSWTRWVASIGKRRLWNGLFRVDMLRRLAECRRWRHQNRVGRRWTRNEIRDLLDEHAYYAPTTDFWSSWSMDSNSAHSDLERTDEDGGDLRSLCDHARTALRHFHQRCFHCRG